MNHPFVTTQEKGKEHTVLIIDKEGVYGPLLAQKIESESTVVLVTPQKPDSSRIIHVPFLKRVPEIPSGTYSHIFLVVEPESNPEHEFLLPLSQKATEDNAKLVYVIPYGLYTDQLKEKIQSLCRQWVIVLLGDVFDSTTTNSQIGKIFYQAKKERFISLPQLGLETVRPIELHDAIEGILRSGFGFDREHISFDFSKHPYTALSLVHTLQKIDPMIKIDFVNDRTAPISPLLPQGLYLFESDYPVMKKLQDAYESFIPPGGSVLKRKRTSGFSVRKSEKPFNTSMPILAIIFGGIFLLLLPLLWTGVTASLGALLLGQTKQAVDSGNLPQAMQYAKASNTLFTWAESGSTILTGEATVLGHAQQVSYLTSQLHATGQLAQAISLVLAGGEDFQTTALGRSKDPQATFAEGTSFVKNALLLVGALHMNYLPNIMQQELSSLKNVLQIADETVDVANRIFGFNGPKTYVVLFQDNNRLRPGGGYISSYAVISLSQGRIINFSIHAVNDADSALKGHVEPPFAMRRYLPLAHWYLADSNFSADFQKDALNAAFFLKTETGIVPDGIIGVDTTFVQTLVQIVRSVYVPGYAQTVTAQNFASLVAANESKATQQASQGKDFLTSLYQAIAQKFLTGHFSYLSLLKQSTLMLLQKHLLFAFADPSVQQVFSVNGFSSTFWDSRIALDNGINDFTTISEANLGMNADNMFIKRQVAQTMTIFQTGSISGVLTISYNNTSDGTWPGGVYKNYLRLLLLHNATITSVVVNGELQQLVPAITDPTVYEAKNFKKPKGLEMETTQEGNRAEYGFLTNDSPKTTLVVTISYVLPQVFDLKKPTLTYDVYLFKQPGTDAYPYTFSLLYPQSVVLQKSPDGSTTGLNEVTTNELLTTDKDYVYAFAQKQ